MYLPNKCRICSSDLIQSKILYSTAERLDCINGYNLGSRHSHYIIFINKSTVIECFLLLFEDNNYLIENNFILHSVNGNNEYFSKIFIINDRLNTRKVITYPSPIDLNISKEKLIQKIKTFNLLK